MENKNHKEHPYAVIDKNGMLIESSEDCNKEVSGYLFDCIQKSRTVLNSEDSINSVEIFFDNYVILMKDNCSTNLSMAMIVDNKK
jgi:hypothetical protein